MRWLGGSESSNVEDRRGMSGGSIAAGGGIIGVVVLLFNLLTGSNVDPAQIPGLNGGGTNQQTNAAPNPEQDKLASFSKVVLKYTEDVWTQQLPQQTGISYRQPTLVLFSDAVQSACGSASSASGPFYCPGDQKLYVDLAFFRELSERFNAAGDFAMAYVIAHEVGHHIQTLMGTSQKMARLRQQSSEEEYNKYSVMLELQADYYAGVWAHYMQGKGVLEAGDMEEALNAAQAIGDDRLTQGPGIAGVVYAWHIGPADVLVEKGFESGDMKGGDTFNARELR